MTNPARIFQSGDGFTVVALLKGHMDQHRNVLPYLAETISKLQLKDVTEPVFRAAIDFGRIIGTSDCVETTAEDHIIYAQRVGRPNLTRFVLHRKPEPCSKVVVVLRRLADAQADFGLLTAFIGDIAEREPGDPSLLTNSDRMVSQRFWDWHALVWGSQKVHRDLPVA
ncbi:hypothetical protein [Ralstonia pseudosolanacearum]|uniref:hypothetical protein n=1 Tax=Ralstonia pseudosolanacearum TaxID=1310165 RepID=UPI003CECAD79